MVSGILHVGNITFEADDEGNASVVNDEELEDVGVLFQVISCPFYTNSCVLCHSLLNHRFRNRQADPELLETTLTFRNMQSGGRSIVVIPLKVEQVIRFFENSTRRIFSC